MSLFKLLRRRRGDTKADEPASLGRYYRTYQAASARHEEAYDSLRDAILAMVEARNRSNRDGITQ